MDKKELTARLDTPMKSQMVANSTAIIENHDLDIGDLFDISFHKKKEIAFRAAWMLEYIVTHEPLQFYPHIEAFLLLLPKQKNPSAMRHYAKIVALMTERKSSLLYKEALGRLTIEPLIELLFIWLVERETLVATKVHCMQALANLVPRYNWIKDELLETVDHLMGIESIAFFARAKMVKKQLKKEAEK
ncbi:MAG: hypothetical protein P0Y49_05725 [Candidatus Pedobacter colombiensis]|uniref:Adenylosuccinate lyase n=1 Tax=Candidatus Pedobacter colombiensis TaxID=3121371 RepID=A0AAJ5WBM9_9SPHI|nr:hypothetical protein [Pedobacter sp.]WEK20635.1 MAG: hypothetical protein P0Y49_05725 [Pedobacter sp.]